jgi:hypothetical protein
MGFNGISWASPDFCGFWRVISEPVLLLFWLRQPVDKSVANESLMLEHGKFSQERIDIVPGAAPQLIDIEQIGIGNDDGLSFADGAARSEPVCADVAVSPQSAW